jgi:hypothetical protein
MAVAAFELEQTNVSEHLQLVGGISRDVYSAEVQSPEIGIGLSEVDITRLLTEVDHLTHSFEVHNSVPDSIKADVTTNLETAVHEISMPFAVSKTAHKIETEQDLESHKLYRTFSWLGRTAVGVAQSGYDFHFSTAAKRRVDIEVEEAIHAQETLRPGNVQFFVSPRMASGDAPVYVAKAEHLHDDDSIRASHIAVDSEGNETHRIMESLLVRDVPLESWVAMLKDENNIFGKSITVSDETSAIGVMEVFSELELPIEVASEGPVTFVAEVVPYIKDKNLQLSVQLQLDKFRNDQMLYKQQAAVSAAEWYDFELELAKSFHQGVTTPSITEFITNVETLWPDTERSIIERHPVENGFVITRELAALAEKTKRNIITTKAAVRTGNEDVIEQVDTDTLQAIEDSSQYGLPGHPHQALQDRVLEQSIIKQNVELGGGCAGSACGLEAVKSDSNEDASLRRELGAESGDIITKDKVRSCNCGKKDIVYAHNSSKVIKKCMSCGDKEVKFTKPK